MFRNVGIYNSDDAHENGTDRVFRNVGIYNSDDALEDGTDRVFRNVGIYNSDDAHEDGTDRVFRNVGIYNSDAGELPKRKHNIFRTRRKFEIKDMNIPKQTLIKIG